MIRNATPSRLRRRGGFTLVEILIVVGIIVVLIAVTVPLVSKSRQQANRVKCANNLRSLGQAVTAFGGEHNAAFPTCGSDKPVYPTSTDWIGWGGIDSTSANKPTDYMNESGLAKYLGFPTLDKTGNPNEKLRNLYRCPSVNADLRGGKAYPYDYQFNAQLSGMPVDRVAHPGAKGLIVEASTFDDGAYCYWKPGPAYPGGTAAGAMDSVALNHGSQGGNCLFADGHVDVMDVANQNEAAAAGASDYSHWDCYEPPMLPPVAPYTFQPRNGSTTWGAAQ